MNVNVYIAKGKKLRERGVALLVAGWTWGRVFTIAAGKPWHIRVLHRAAVVVFFCLCFLVAFDCNFLWLFGKGPDLGMLVNPRDNTTTEVYGADSALIGKFYYENRSPVDYADISPRLVKTLVATEDERFYSHHGVDLVGLLPLVVDAAGGHARGGSTITQQLAKNLFDTRSRDGRGLLGYIPPLRMAFIKLREWITAVKIEILYSKNEIIAMYLNAVDFGSNAYGIKTAARTYFNTTPDSLTWRQSALLVGMLKATTTYSPILHPRRCRDRRNLVLRKLADHRLIGRQQADSLSRLPLGLEYTVEKNYSGFAPYFRMAVLQSLDPWLSAKRRDIYSGGLRIYTTLDTAMQHYAEDAVEKNMRRLQRLFDDHWLGLNPWVDSRDVEMPGFIEAAALKSDYGRQLAKQYGSDTASIWKEMRRPRKTSLFSWKYGDIDTTLSFMDELRYIKRLLHAGFVAMDPSTGAVRAYVGDINFDHFKFDNVSQSRRQPGSTFKAFVYAAAMESGYGPCDTLPNRPVTIAYVENGAKKSWSPHNADWTSNGEMQTLKGAFARSLNTITVQVAKAIGWRKVNEYARRLGIDSPLDTVPSICLGSSDVSLIELVRAYCPFVNGGYRIDPLFVTAITDDKGKILYRAEPKKTRVLTDDGLFYMTQMFRGTTTEPLGTTQALFEFDIFKRDVEFGGKTGTSSNHSDGWFVGVSPRLVAGAWVGGSERSIHFRTSELGEGCHTALPIFGLFMEKVMNDPHFNGLHARFSPPDIANKRCFACQTIVAAKPDSAASDSLGKL